MGSGHWLIPKMLLTVDAYRRRLGRLLATNNFDFSCARTSYPPHSLHPFPAKFPPQLARFFIERLTVPGEVVLDPMMGSGTSLVECQQTGRRCYGFDIDPLAVLLATAKTQKPSIPRLWRAYDQTVELARQYLGKPSVLQRMFERRFDEADKKFLKFWFPAKSRKHLLALALSVEKTTKQMPDVRAWLWALISSIIIRKEPSVSLARDLSHSRPHKSNGVKLKSPLQLLENRFSRALDEIDQIPVTGGNRLAMARRADCRQHIPLRDNSVDLIVTSPPYATAIDYLRSHKFSLIWMGYTLKELTRIKRRQIGGPEQNADSQEDCSSNLKRKIALIRRHSVRQARSFHKYFIDLERAIREMHRVLRPGRCLIIVVAPCFSNGYRIDVHRHLAHLLERSGFKVCGWARRKINRDRRMLPLSSTGAARSGIERRMHREYIVGGVKKSLP